MIEGILLVFNLIGAIVFFVFQAKKGQQAFFAFFFIMLPILGFIIYGVILILDKTHLKNRYDRQSLVKRFAIEKNLKKPEVETELNIIPVGDVMAVGKNQEKRKLFLDELKKNVYGNYRELLVAGKDSDSETVHYVASARMEVYRRLYEQVRQASDEYANERSSIEKLLILLNRIMELIESDLLSVSESKIQKKKFCELIEHASIEQKEELCKGEYGHYITYMIETDNYEHAKKIWMELPSEYKTEKVYAKMLEMYYELGEQNHFYHVLDELCTSGIVLSTDGINMVRFWLMERA